MLGEQFPINIQFLYWLERRSWIVEVKHKDRSWALKIKDDKIGDSIEIKVIQWNKIGDSKKTTNQVVEKQW